MIKKTVLFYSTSMIVGLYTTYVLTVLWSWFVVPTFHVSDAPFWMMYGLTMIISLFRTDHDLDATQRFRFIAVMLDACLPAEKREHVKEELKWFEKEVWENAGFQILGRVIENTFALGLGFAVHALASS